MGAMVGTTTNCAFEGAFRKVPAYIPITLGNSMPTRIADAALHEDIMVVCLEA